MEGQGYQGNQFELKMVCEKNKYLWAHVFHCAFCPFIVMAACAIANVVKSSFGPVGLDKMMVDDIGVSYLFIVFFYKLHCSIVF